MNGWQGREPHSPGPSWQRPPACSDGSVENARHGMKQPFNDRNRRGRLELTALESQYGVDGIKRAAPSAARRCVALPAVSAAKGGRGVRARQAAASLSLTRVLHGCEVLRFRWENTCGGVLMYGRALITLVKCYFSGAGPGFPHGSRASLIARGGRRCGRRPFNGLCTCQDGHV
jgi:hypothetical protein